MRQVYMTKDRLQELRVMLGMKLVQDAEAVDVNGKPCDFDAEEAVAWSGYGAAAKILGLQEAQTFTCATRLYKLLVGADFVAKPPDRLDPYAQLVGWWESLDNAQWRLMLRRLDSAYRGDSDSRKLTRRD